MALEEHVVSHADTTISQARSAHCVRAHQFSPTRGCLRKVVIVDMVNGGEVPAEAVTRYI